MTQVKVPELQAALEKSPTKSIRMKSRELTIPKSSVHKVMRKRLVLYSYKLQLVQQLKPDDKLRRLHFATEKLFEHG